MTNHSLLSDSSLRKRTDHSDKHKAAQFGKAFYAATNQQKTFWHTATIAVVLAGTFHLWQLQYQDKFWSRQIKALIDSDLAS